MTFRPPLHRLLCCCMSFCRFFLSRQCGLLFFHLGVLAFASCFTFTDTCEKLHFLKNWFTRREINFSYFWERDILLCFRVLRTTSPPVGNISYVSFEHFFWMFVVCLASCYRKNWFSRYEEVYI